jgi:hypothetical protein
MKELTTITLSFSICGASVSQKYEGLDICASKCIINYFKNQYKNCIELDYKFNVENHITKDDGAFHSLLLKEAKYFIYIFNLFLMRPSELVILKAKKGEETFNIKATEKNAPEMLYNFVRNFNHDVNPIIARYNTHINNEGWQIFEKTIKFFNCKNNEFKDSIYLALRWFQKGCDELDSIDKLIAFWISFNSLYQNTDEREEKKAIKKYIQVCVTESLASEFIKRNKRLIGLLSNFNIELGKGDNKINVSEQLSNSLKALKPQYIEIVKFVALSIYGIRNSLFHGSINLDDEKYQAKIETCETLLAELLKEVICFLIIGNPLPNIKFREKEEISI